MSRFQTTLGGICRVKNGGLALHFGVESANILATKVKYFLLTFMGLIIIIGLLTKFFGLFPWFSSGAMLLLFIVMQLAFHMDMSRYDLSLFSSVITAWKEGKDPQSALEKTETTPGIAGD